MANIPQYQSKQGLVKEGPQVQQSVAEVVKYGQGANLQTLSKGVSDLGNSMTDIQNQIAKVDNANNTSKAEVERTRLLYEAEQKRKGMAAQEATVDAEVQTKKITDQVANTYFKNPAFKQEYLRQQEIQDAVYVIGQKSIIAKQVVGERKVLVLRDLELAKSNYINAPDEASRLVATQKIESIVNNPANEQVYTPEEKYKLVEDTIKDAQADLKDAESLKKRKEKEISLAANEAKNAREQDLIKMRVNQKDANGIAISPEELIKQTRADMNAGNINPKFAEAYINSLKSAKAVGVKTKSVKFVGFVNDMLFNKTKPKDINLALMEANTTGAVSDEDFNALVTFNQDVNASNKLEQMLPNVSFLKGAMYWGDENAGARDESKIRIFKDYMNQLKQGTDPEIAAQQSIKNEVLYLFPQAKSAPKEGIDIVDKNGTVKHITPDGELTVKENKTK